MFRLFLIYIKNTWDVRNIWSWWLNSRIHKKQHRLEFEKTKLKKNIDTMIFSIHFSPIRSRGDISPTKIFYSVLGIGKSELCLYKFIFALRIQISDVKKTANIWQRSVVFSLHANRSLVGHYVHQFESGVGNFATIQPKEKLEQATDTDLEYKEAKCLCQPPL